MSYEKMHGSGRTNFNLGIRHDQGSARCRIVYCTVRVGLTTSQIRITVRVVLIDHNSAKTRMVLNNAQNIQLFYGINDEVQLLDEKLN